MATRLCLLLPLATLALAAFSAQARKTSTFHDTAAPSYCTRIVNRRPPPSPIGRHHAAAPSPAHQQEPAMPPEPYRGLYKCLEKITEECGMEIYGGIFWNDDDGVRRRCCGELVRLGKRCHNGIMKATLALPEMAEIDKSKTKKRGAEIWSRCVFITNLEAGNNQSIDSFALE